MCALPSYGGNAFINFRWVNTYIVTNIFLSCQSWNDAEGVTARSF